MNDQTMTLLNACERGGMCKVVKNNAKGSLKQRLISFGLMKGSVIRMLEHSPTKSTFEIKIGNVSLALRKEEAQLIEVTHVQY